MFFITVVVISHLKCVWQLLWKQRRRRRNNLIGPMFEKTMHEHVLLEMVSLSGKYHDSCDRIVILCLWLDSDIDVSKYPFSADDIHYF